MRIDEDSSAYSESFKRVECMDKVKPVYPPFNFIEAGGIRV